MSKRIWSLVAAGALAVGVLPVQHALAGPSTPTESGCYNITVTPEGGKSEGGYQQVVRSASQSGNGSLTSPYSQMQVTYFPDDAAAVEAFVLLEAPSCTAATYNLVIYPDVAPGVDPLSAKPIRTVSQRGDGASGASMSNRFYIYGLFDHTTATCVYTVLEVAEGRNVIDTAPNAGAVRQCKDGGSAQGYGG